MKNTFLWKGGINSQIVCIAEGYWGALINSRSMYSKFDENKEAVQIFIKGFPQFVEAPILFNYEIHKDSKIDYTFSTDFPSITYSVANLEEIRATFPSLTFFQNTDNSVTIFNKTTLALLGVFNPSDTLVDIGEDTPFIKKGKHPNKFVAKQKPIVFEAIQWTGSNVEEVKKFLTPFIPENKYFTREEMMEKSTRLENERFFCSGFEEGIKKGSYFIADGFLLQVMDEQEFRKQYTPDIITLDTIEF